MMHYVISLFVYENAKTRYNWPGKDPVITSKNEKLFADLSSDCKIPYKQMHVTAIRHETAPQ